MKISIVDFWYTVLKVFVAIAFVIVVLSFIVAYLILHYSLSVGFITPMDRVKSNT